MRKLYRQVSVDERLPKGFSGTLITYDKNGIDILMGFDSDNKYDLIDLKKYCTHWLEEVRFHSEEIIDGVSKIYNGYDEELDDGEDKKIRKAFQDGAKWLRDEILKGGI